MFIASEIKENDREAERAHVSWDLYEFKHVAMTIIRESELPVDIDPRTGMKLKTTVTRREVADLIRQKIWCKNSSRMEDDARDLRDAEL